MKYVPQGNLRIYAGVVWFFASIVMIIFLIVLKDPDSYWLMTACASAILSYCFTTFVCCMD